MKVILLKQVPNVGQKYDVKNVSDGYALNFLFPNQLAESATDSAVKRILNSKAKEDAEKAVREDLLVKNIQDLEGVRITVSEAANAKGHLFAGVHASELVAIIKEQTHLDVLPEHILLEKPIKEIGEHIVPVKVRDIEAKFTLVVEAK
jgi:large subunit ribosomal protein L9